MMNDGELITNRKAFSFLSRECEKIIDTSKRLPEFVFRRSFNKYFVIEYAHIYKKEFAAFLSQMSTVHKDEFVNYMSLDPHPVDYYYEHSSVFGLASFRSPSLSERYLPVLYREQGVSKLLAGVNVGVFWGSSLKWGIFCDRISWEMAVIAVSENVDVPTLSGLRCWNASEVSSYVKSQYSTKDPSNSIALEFSQKFLANYHI